jgi:hypothetical protein
MRKACGRMTGGWLAVPALAGRMSESHISRFRLLLSR